MSLSPSQYVFFIRRSYLISGARHLSFMPQTREAGHDQREIGRLRETPYVGILSEL